LHHGRPEAFRTSGGGAAYAKPQAFQPYAQLWQATLSNEHHRVKVDVMLKRIIGIIFGVLAVALLNAIVSQSQDGEIAEANLNTPIVTASPAEIEPPCERPKKQIPADTVIASFDRLTHHDYLIQTRYKMVLDVPRRYGSPRKPVKAPYVIVSSKGRAIAKFDANLYSSLSNRMDAGFFPLLGKDKDQLVISRDLPKTGAQWVADFGSGFKIIFNGQTFRVGREAGDMTISDLDDDGIYEIIVPITAFYGFESGRLSTMDTPLPFIIFRYDPIQNEYLPANPHFRVCLLRDTEAAAKSVREVEREIGLGRLMSIVLDYVFVGEEQRGWKLFEEMCDLPDKARIRSDMQHVLKAHPVYRYIYKQTANR
jgi:hypothetical protein